MPWDNETQEYITINLKPICDDPQDGCMSTAGGFRLCTNPAHHTEPDYETLGPVWHRIREWPPALPIKPGTYLTEHTRVQDVHW